MTAENLIAQLSKIAYAVLTKDGYTAIITGTGTMHEFAPDGWHVVIDHEGTSEEMVSELISEGYHRKS